MVSVTFEIFNRQNIKLTKGVYEDKELTWCVTITLIYLSPEKDKSHQVTAWWSQHAPQLKIQASHLRFKTAKKGVKFPSGRNY